MYTGGVVAEGVKQGIGRHGQDAAPERAESGARVQRMFHRVENPPRVDLRVYSEDTHPNTSQLNRVRKTDRELDAKVMGKD